MPVPIATAQQRRRVDARSATESERRLAEIRHDLATTAPPREQAEVSIAPVAVASPPPVDIAGDLVSRLVRAELPSRTVARINGVSYRLTVTRQSETDGIEARIASATLWAESHCLTGAACAATSDVGHDAAVERFLGDHPAVIRAFADVAIARLYSELHPVRPRLHRVRIASASLVRVVRHNRLKTITLLIPCVAVAAPLLLVGLGSGIVTGISMALSVIASVTGRNLLDTARCEAQRNRTAAAVTADLHRARLAGIEDLDRFAREARQGHLATPTPRPSSAPGATAAGSAIS